MVTHDYILPESVIVARARALRLVRRPRCRLLRPHFDRRVYDWLQWQQWVVLITAAQATDGIQVDEMSEVARGAEAMTLMYSKKKKNSRLTVYFNVRQPHNTPLNTASIRTHGHKLYEC